MNQFLHRRHALLAILFCMAVGAHAQTTMFNGVTVPGVVIDHSPKSSGVYLTSPTITIMSDGSYMAATDLSGPGSTEHTVGHTRLYRSTDDGQTWTEQSEVVGAFWSSLFEYENDLYLMGPSAAGGDWVIRRSTDNGATWTNPTNSTNGLIAQGTFGSSPAHPELYSGRLWAPASGPRAISATAGSDLLNANDWVISDPVPEEFEWFNENITWTEAQVVVSPQTGLVMMPKIKNHPVTSLLRANPANGQLTFDDENDFVDLPGADKKFGAKYDPVSGKFYVLSNAIPSAHADETPTNAVRNTAAIVSSNDLYHWDVVKLFLYTPNLSNKEGFNYLMFDIDGDDLALVSRTSWDDGLGGADSNGNANFFTFHRIEDFRDASPKQVLVADTSNDRVMRYEVTQTDFWAPIGEFALGSTFAGTALDQPVGLAQDANGNVYVGEQKDGGRVLRFDALGNFLGVVATEGVDFTGQPEALTVGPDGKLYMSVAFGTDSDKVYRVDPSDDSVSTFVSSTFDGGTLNNPRGIAFASDGNLYVADRQNGKVRKFSGADGAYLGDVFSNVRPEALTWDEAQQKLLTSSRSSAVDLYDVALDGTDNKFYDPTDIGLTLGIVAIDEDIYWTDFTNDHIYKLKGPDKKVSSVPVDLDAPSHLLQIDQAAPGERAWLKSGSADWKELTNWFYWGRPDTNEEIANFGSSADADSTITMDQSYTMKGLRFRNTSRHTIIGSGSISLEAASGRSVLDTQLGNHHIAVPVVLNSDLDAMTSAGAKLHFTGDFDLNGCQMSITGEGQFSIAGQFVMHGGTLVLDGQAPLVFASTSNPTLDGDLVFDPNADLSLVLDSSFVLVNGITNTQDQFNNLILPDLEEGLAWDTSTFYSAGILSIIPVLSADYDKDGDVDGSDFLRWQCGYGTDVGPQNTAPLVDGNANGDQFIDGDDLAIWVAQYGTEGIPLSASAEVVPEPSCLALVLLGITIITCITTNGLADGTLHTGEAIGVGTDSQVGVLSLPSISCSPLGMAYISGQRRPDLFVVADRWHPAIYLYRWINDNEAGTPIFSQPIELSAPFPEAASSPGYLFSNKAGDTFGFWLRSGKLVTTTFDPKTDRFEVLSQTAIDGLPKNPKRVAVRMVDNKHLEGFVTVGDGTVHKPGHHRDKDYNPFDGAGIWRGGFPRDGIFHFRCEWPKLPRQINTEVVLTPSEGALLGINSLEWIETPGSKQPRLLYGTKLGGVFYLTHAFSDMSRCFSREKKHVIEATGYVLRHPTVGTHITAYPSAEGDRTDLIVAGEGGMYYYRHADSTESMNALAFETPRHVLQESPDLYDGSLVVPNVVDWNGDGRLDIVAGNALGRLLFFENQGTSQRPRFLPATYVQAGGEPVLIRGGYRGSIQGPGEAHWGYTCPTVVDWNQDGLLDVLMHDIRGIHAVYMNDGSPTKPKLALPRQLCVESLEMHGTWRTRPAAGLLGDRMAYVTLDDDDQVHLYWRIDNYNLDDGGNLLLTDGSPIQANFLHAGGTGRGKFQFVDWDQDGAVDLLVGTPRHSSFPEPKHGVPWSMDRAGSAVLLLRNTGSNEQPSFEYPVVMQSQDQTMHFGQHSCAPFATTMGSEDGKTLNVVVGTETGQMVFFHGKDVGWRSVRSPE